MNDVLKKIKEKWLREREVLGYINLEYGRLIDLFVKDLGFIERSKKMEKTDENTKCV